MAVRMLCIDFSFHEYSKAVTTKYMEITTAVWFLHHEIIINQIKCEWEWVRQKEYGNEERGRYGGESEPKVWYVYNDILNQQKAINITKRFHKPDI